MTISSNSISSAPISGDPPSFGGDITVEIGIATETDTALPITPAKVVQIGIASETDTALSITPLIFAPFNFPVIGSFYTDSILGPRWRVYFYEPGTTTDKNVRNNSGVEHSNPVVLDRFGNIPDITVETSETYRIVIKNQHDVEKYTIPAFEYPDVTYNLVMLGLAEETDTALSVTPA